MFKYLYYLTIYIFIGTLFIYTTYWLENYIDNTPHSFYDTLAYLALQGACNGHFLDILKKKKKKKSVKIV